MDAPVGFIARRRATDSVWPTYHTVPLELAAFSSRNPVASAKTRQAARSFRHPSTSFLATDPVIRQHSTTRRVHSERRRRVRRRETRSPEKRPHYAPLPNRRRHCPVPGFDRASTHPIDAKLSAGSVYHRVENPVAEEALKEAPSSRGEIPPRIPSTAASSASSLPPPMTISLPVAAPTAPVLERDVLHISQAKRNAGSSLRNVQAWHCHGYDVVVALVFRPAGKMRSLWQLKEAGEGRGRELGVMSGAV